VLIYIIYIFLRLKKQDIISYLEYILKYRYKRGGKKGNTNIFPTIEMN